MPLGQRNSAWRSAEGGGAFHDRKVGRVRGRETHPTEARRAYQPHMTFRISRCSIAAGDEGKVESGNGQIWADCLSEVSVTCHD
jgi:hypothetical protein